jgi:phage shock protein E
VTPAEGAAIQADPPPGLVILDVRTPEEFGEGHLDGAIMVDFYQDDFASQIAELDHDQPYLVYCRSGSRSGQTRAIMDELGFTDVADVDGGIIAWTEAGLDLTS